MHTGMESLIKIKKEGWKVEFVRERVLRLKEYLNDINKSEKTFK